MDRKKLFHPQGDDSISARRIILWNTTNILNLNAVKYQWATGLYRVMTNNTWFPEKINMSDDVLSYRNLTPAEKRAYQGILSFLIFLDSIQTNHVPNFNEYITAPEINILIAIQAFQEAIHSQSYQTVLESVVEKDERDSILYFWRDNDVLLQRNRYIGNIYQQLLDEPSQHHLFEAMVANFLLEGLYFYNGFAFFDHLADQGKMLGTQKMISYIRRDELTHMHLFANMFLEIKKEQKELFDADIVRMMMQEAVKQEIVWSQHILGTEHIGITPKTITEYTQYLANDRLRMIGLEPLYPWVTNPYKHLERFAEVNNDRTDFFESKVINYTQSSGLAGSWDDF